MLFFSKTNSVFFQQSPHSANSQERKITCCFFQIRLHTYQLHTPPQCLIHGKSYAFQEVHNLQSDLVQQKRTAELKEAAESSKDTTPGSTTTTTTTTDVHSDDQLQGSTDDNSPSLLLLPSSTPTIISEVGCKIFLVI